MNMDIGSANASKLVSFFHFQVMPLLNISSVADPGFEEGGFQVCGQSPHGCCRQLPHKQSMLGESGGMPPQKIFCKMDALRRVFLHSGAILGAYIAEQKNPSFSVVL